MIPLHRTLLKWIFLGNFPKGFRARHFGVGGVGGKNGNE
jgi:hypothetical protein